MGKLQAAYWLLMILPCAISLAGGMAVRIRQKNLSAHINKKPSAHSPRATLALGSLKQPAR